MALLSQQRRWRQKQRQILIRANLLERLDLPHLRMVDPHLPLHLPMVDLHLLHPSIILSQFTLLPIR